MKAASAEFMESAREVGAWIPACDALPAEFAEVDATNGRVHFEAFVDPEGVWFFDSRRPCPVGYLTHWKPKAKLPDGRIEQ